jgi:hypothetical protein
MICQKCSSENQSTFNGEVAIHFLGLKGLDKSIVWVFPKLAVCLRRGFTEFTVPERELRVLLHDTSVVDAIVLTASGTPERAKRSASGQV